ncbi:MAG TPA: RIP metalloprotease RseP, partial [Candidatus Omnitrophica bacterium]|nr:RIP metalloprotease RseP [Candidatus Omnitrophota bacterium]
MIMVIIVFGFIIFIHELAHFLVAKKMGVSVEVFSIGFGPKIFSFKRNGTEYKISSIPLGGYV